MNKIYKIVSLHWRFCCRDHFSANILLFPFLFIWQIFFPNSALRCMKFRAKMCTCVNLRVVEVKKVALSRFSMVDQAKQRVVKFATKWFSSCIYTYIHLFLSLYISLYFSFARSLSLTHTAVWLSWHHCVLRWHDVLCVCSVWLCLCPGMMWVSQQHYTLTPRRSTQKNVDSSWVLQLLLFRAFVSCAFVCTQSQ